MAQGPDVGADCLQLPLRELRATHGRHGAAILLRARHSQSDCFRDSGEASIAPQIFLRGEVGTQRRSFSILAMASRAGSSG